MTIRYAITHINKDGVRQLTLANQGHNHYQTRSEADQALEELRGPEGLCKVLTADEVATLEVRWIDCHESGDATGIWFDTPHSPHERRAVKITTFPGESILLQRWQEFLVEVDNPRFGTYGFTNRRMVVAVNKEGHTDYPIYQNGHVLYDRPEEFTKAFKAMVRATLRTRANKISS